MIVVIIAGGSGTRLWPLSTHDYPKHLLKLTNDRSLLQNTYDRVCKLTEDKNIFVVPEISHVSHVYEQLPNIPKVNILCEPGRRGTAACFLLALSEIKKRGYDDQAVLFLWADHLIRDSRGFVSSAKQAAEIAEKQRRLVFIGIEPSYASTILGYMEKGEQQNDGLKNVFELKQFVEKPDHNTAEQYFQSGNYLWNAGYLTGLISTFELEIKENNSHLWKNYQELLGARDIKKIYLAFEPQAIDTALSEHVKDALVIPGSFDWMDIGSFRDLHGVSHQDEAGNYVKGSNVDLENVTNSFVRNEQEIPIAVIGLDNIAVVANENGILITNKTYDQKVGDVSKRIQEKT